MPKQQIQAEQSASAHAVAVVVDSGNTLALYVVLSTMVKMWVHHGEGGRGPTRSTRMWEKRHLGMGMTDGGGEM